MDTKEVAQGYEENIKRAFDIIEKCKSKENSFLRRKGNQKPLNEISYLKIWFDLFYANQPLFQPLDKI